MLQMRKLRLIEVYRSQSLSSRVLFAYPSFFAKAVTEVLCFFLLMNCWLKNQGICWNPSFGLITLGIKGRLTFCILLAFLRDNTSTTPILVQILGCMRTTINPENYLTTPKRVRNSCPLLHVVSPLVGRPGGRNSTSMELFYLPWSKEL